MRRVFGMSRKESSLPFQTVHCIGTSQANLKATNNDSPTCSTHDKPPTVDLHRASSNSVHMSAAPSNIFRGRSPFATGNLVLVVGVGGLEVRVVFHEFSTRTSG